MSSPSPLCDLNSTLWDQVNLFDSLMIADCGDNDLRLLGWRGMKETVPAAPLNIPKMMEELEQEFLGDGKPLVDNVDLLFKNFATKLSSVLEVIPFQPEQTRS